jgi:glycogen debranching enzyme
MDERYRPRYEGSAKERDSAYHQGTVWPFLLGPFVTAWLKTFGKNTARRAECRSFLTGLGVQLQECCVGHVSELFDGDAPHDPKGCPAQAWSVAEPLRALIEDLERTTAGSAAGPKRRAVARPKKSARSARLKKNTRST